MFCRASKYWSGCAARRASFGHPCGLYRVYVSYLGVDEMACRAVLFAITATDVERLLAATEDESVREIVDDIEERWDESWLCELDKAWDGLHRCFTDGEIEIDNGEYPLNHAILGGKQVYR
jgi:hypothetical protein